ncbi:MAG: class I SAM-dependent methyltransferase [Micromonosporaceae bacterium]|nr:class I SAM-dependent methyltransferase [Micromonosporaceae bacterium]
MTSMAHHSQTALIAAAARAAHLIVDGKPVIFADPLAEALLGSEAEELLGYHRAYGEEPILASVRTQMICRSRFTEDRVAAGVAGGLDQYVILGAGLDSFAYRSALAGRLRIFEVDQPATQQWKRERLARAGIAEPEWVTFVPLDLETDALVEQLRRGGFDASRAAVVSWLGVSMYLSRAALTRTFTVLGGLANDTEVIMDYLLPKDLRDAAGQQYVDLISATVADLGEPWRTCLAPDEIAAMLEEHGFEVLENVGQPATLDAELWKRDDALRPSELLSIVHARVCC